MLGEGESAPAFDLPGVVDDDVERVSLADTIGEEVVILAFYPGDFNPACSETESDLGDLDLFTMEQDVSVYAVSADSVYSHRAFVDAYDLQVPLLSDLRAEVAEDYGVAAADPSAGHLVGRAVFVVGLEGEIEFAWSTDEVGRRPPTDRIRNSVDGVGAGGTADDRYADGHTSFVEGSSQFDVGEEAFDEDEWAKAHENFKRAAEEFASAAEAFDTAIRFVEDDEKLIYFERAEEQVETFAHAAEWLAESADAYDRGEGAEGAALEEDAQGPLEAARAVHDPIPPEDFPPAEDPAGGDGAGASDVATLDLDIGDALAASDAEAGPGGEAADTDAGTPTASGAAEEGDRDVDDQELAEITAGLEGQIKSGPSTIAEALGADDDGRSDGTTEASSGQAEASGEPAGASEADADGDLELDLTDPSSGEDELLEPTERQADEEEENA
ncbi:MAG: redoxin domain-containing protein [Haloarculaceae archaeon]